jgi:hypothetical protein
MRLIKSSLSRLLDSTLLFCAGIAAIATLKKAASPFYASREERYEACCAYHYVINFGRDYDNGTNHAGGKSTPSGYLRNPFGERQ